MKTRSIQTALVTGGGSGMGRAVALGLCRSGMRVFVADLNPAAAGETVQLADDLQARAYEVDVSQSNSVAALFNDLKQPDRASGPAGSYCSGPGANGFHRKFGR